jgi:hypothetical protein
MRDQITGVAERAVDIAALHNFFDATQRRISLVMFSKLRFTKHNY